MKKRIERYILNEPWEDRFNRLTERIELRIIKPFLVIATIYVVYMVVAGSLRIGG